MIDLTSRFDKGANSGAYNHSQRRQKRTQYVSTINVATLITHEVDFML
jgi:hypothetical protein